MLDRFSDGGRMAFTRAHDEARRLGHVQIGTEHLLLGILADADSQAGRAVVAAGATLAACRSKVAEAVGQSSGSAATADLILTDRARRALERADRLSLRRRDAHVEPDHVLVSLLDVEGRAGQVLRGLGVDVAVLRNAVATALEGTRRPDATDDVAAQQPSPQLPSPRCVACGRALAGGLSHRVVGSRDPEGNERDLLIAYCSFCGASVGASIDGPRPGRP